MTTDSTHEHKLFQEAQENAPDLSGADVARISVYMVLFTVVFFAMMAALVPYFFHEVSLEQARKSAHPRTHELTELRMEEDVALHNYDHAENAIPIDEAMHKVVAERQHR